MLHMIVPPLGATMTTSVSTTIASDIAFKVHITIYQALYCILVNKIKQFHAVVHKSFERCLFFSLKSTCEKRILLVPMKLPTYHV